MKMLCPAGSSTIATYFSRANAIDSHLNTPGGCTHPDENGPSLGLLKYAQPTYVSLASCCHLTYKHLT